MVILQGVFTHLSETFCRFPTDSWRTCWGGVGTICSRMFSVWKKYLIKTGKWVITWWMPSIKWLVVSDKWHTTGMENSCNRLYSMQNDCIVILYKHCHCLSWDLVRWSGSLWIGYWLHKDWFQSARWPYIIRHTSLSLWIWSSVCTNGTCVYTTSHDYIVQDMVSDFYVLFWRAVCMYALSL